MRLGVMASGAGTTLQAVLDATEQGELDARVCLVISNNGASGALTRARAAGIPLRHLSALTHPEPKRLDRAILNALEQEGAEVVLLLGYMKKLGPTTLAGYRGRILNTHPALLPKFGGRGMHGMQVHRAVLEAGETETGVTLHQVEAEYDTGPIVAQTSVPVLPGDTAESLAERVQMRERTFLVEVLRRITLGERLLEAWPTR